METENDIKWSEKKEKGKKFSYMHVLIKKKSCRKIFEQLSFYSFNRMKILEIWISCMKRRKYLNFKIFYTHFYKKIVFSLGKFSCICRLYKNNNFFAFSNHSLATQALQKLTYFLFPSLFSILLLFKRNQDNSQIEREPWWWTARQAQHSSPLCKLQSPSKHPRLTVEHRDHGPTSTLEVHDDETNVDQDDTSYAVSHLALQFPWPVVSPQYQPPSTLGLAQFVRGHSKRCM